MNMSMFVGVLFALGFYALIGYGIYLLLRKSSKYLANRLLLPTADINLYLKEIDTSNEERVRKQWFITFVLINIFGFIYPYLSLRSSGAFNIGISIGIIAISLIPSIWITYYCAYQKRGSAFLLCLIITFPFSIFGLIAKEYFGLIMKWSPALVAVSISYITIAIFYWINCIRLRKVNLTRRFHKNALILQEKFKAL